MPEFIFIYHGGEKPDSPEEGARLVAQWEAWIDDLDDAMVNAGTPVGLSKTVSADGVTDDGGANPVSGFSVVAANDMDAAVAMAKSCPFLAMGTIEVAEMLQM